MARMLGPYPASTPGVACQGKVTRYKPFELQTHWEVGREGFLKGTDFRKILEGRIIGKGNGGRLQAQV